MHYVTLQEVASTPAPLAAAPTQNASIGQLVELKTLEGKAMDLEQKLAEGGIATNRLREQRDKAAPADRPRLDKQLADAQHDMTVTAIQLRSTHDQIDRLTLVQAAPTAITVQTPPYDPFPTSNQIMQFSVGGMLLMFPLVLALARRLWVRAPHASTVDLESSPRLQRMEQAIESIAVEVERIGEAQRFATKLLAERQIDVEANRIAPVGMPVPRREPGTITPH